MVCIVILNPAAFQVSGKIPVFSSAGYGSVISRCSWKGLLSITGQPPSLHAAAQPTLNLLHLLERNNVQGMQLQIISCLGFTVRP